MDMIALIKLSFLLVIGLAGFLSAFGFVLQGGFQ
jgi:hypothetical protein